MRYIKSKDYVSPLNVLLKRIEHFENLFAYKDLKSYVQALITLDYEKFVTPLILEELEKELKDHLLHYHYYDSEQYELCYEENVAGQNEIKSRMKEQRDKLKRSVNEVQRYKALMKSGSPDMWEIFLNIKKEYGIVRHHNHENTTAYLKGLTDPLLNHLLLFVGRDSFPISSLVSRSNKEYRTYRPYHKVLGMGERDEHLTRKELKAMPVITLIEAIKVIQEDTKNIVKDDIYHARNSETMDSYKKQFERYGSNFDQGKWILEWWENIVKLDPNHKLILIQ